MSRTPAQAVAAANGIRVGYGGRCLQFVRVCYGIGAKFPSAKAAWAGAKRRHTTSSTASIPVGAPIFLTHPNSRYGHVAIYLGNGNMRTTNSTTNRIHTDSVKKWVGWGYKVDGWTEDLNGVTIPGLRPLPRPTVTKWLRSGSTGGRVRNLQAGLNRVFPAYSKLAVDGSFGPATDRVVKEFQRRTGLVQDGSVGPATTRELAKHGIKF